MTSLALASEDATGAWIVQQVTNAHVLAITRVTTDRLQHFRSWQGFDGREWLPLRQVRALAKERFGNHFMGKGRFDNAPGADDAVMFRKLFQLLASDDQPPDIAVVARDLDGNEDRRIGFQQAARARAWPFDIVGALAQPEAEAWLVATWRPADVDERDRHGEVKQACSLDPVTESHRLTSTAHTRRDAKVVLEALTRTRLSNRDHFAAMSLDELRACGQHNGLREFVDQLGRVLAKELHDGDRA